MTKYENVGGWLRDKIADGSFVQKIPSENELAMQFGCSRQTIRQAIHLLEKDGILKSAQGSGTYITGCPSRLKPTATMRIGVIAASLDNSLLPDIIRGIEAVLSNRCYTVSLGTSHGCQTGEENALRRLMENGVDGLIIEGTKSALPNVNELLYREIKNRKIPIVFINDFYRNFRESYVIMDEIRAGELAALALIEKGHTKIGGIFQSDDMRGPKRYEGVQNIIKEQCPDFADQFFAWYTAEELLYLFSGNSASLLLSRFSGATALLCHNDHIAVSLFELFGQHQIRVPQDISIVSFGHSLSAGAPLRSLAGVVCPAVNIGQCAAELILKKLSDPLCQECIVLEPEIEHTSSIWDIRENRM